MNKTVIRNKGVLKQIRLGFSRLRRDQPGKWSGYPEALKVLTLSAIEQGYSFSEVAYAAGVSEESIRNWRKSDATPPPIPEKIRPLELKVVKSHEAFPSSIPRSPENNASIPAPEAIARIELRSGVRMTIPASALSDRLVRLLMGDAS
jgi:hypothetical protein